MEIGRIRMRCHRLDDRFPQPHCTTLSWHIHTTYFSFFLFFNDDGDDDLMRLWLVWCGVQLIRKLKVMFRWSLVEPAPLPLLRRRRRSSSSSSFPPVAVAEVVLLVSPPPPPSPPPPFPSSFTTTTTPRVAITSFGRGWWRQVIDPGGEVII